MVSLLLVTCKYPNIYDRWRKLFAQHRTSSVRQRHSERNIGSGWKEKFWRTDCYCWNIFRRGIGEKLKTGKGNSVCLKRYYNWQYQEYVAEMLASTQFNFINKGINLFEVNSSYEHECWTSPVCGNVHKV